MPETTMSQMPPKRPRNKVGPASKDIQDFLNATKTPYNIERLLQQYGNKLLDEELEVLSTEVLRMDVNVDDFAEVWGPMHRGQPKVAMNALVSRMRRRFSKLLLDHQRGELDLFLDAAVSD